MYLYEKSPLCFGNQPIDGKVGDGNDFASAGVIPPIQSVLGSNLNQPKEQENQVDLANDPQTKVNVEKLLDLVQEQNQ